MMLMLICQSYTHAISIQGKEKGNKEKEKLQRKQKSETHVRLGDQLYENYEFYAASEEYKKALEKNPENTYALYMYAEACREFFDYANAESSYKKVIDRDNSTYPLARFWYGFMQLDNGRYEQAKNTFNTFLNEYKESGLKAEEYREKANQGINGCDFALAEMKKPVRDYTFEILPTPVNTEYSEYSPVIAKHDSMIVLTSSRPESKGSKENTSLGGSYSDMFRFENINGTWTATGDEDKFNELNTPFNESAGSFNGDKTKFYFTRCDEVIKTGSIQETNCVIYMAKKGSDSIWGPAVKLNENVNMKNQWNGQPSVSPDGKVLFFVSKRPGGLGMSDIWYSTSSGKDDWRAPINMGEGVNSIFIDMAPRYYAQDKILFFSSNGRDGIGGLDIFMSREETQFTETKNIGMPFNSNRDDFYFVLGAKKGYVTSNRQNGKGNDDIYTFNIKSKETLLALIEKDSIIEEAKSVSVAGVILNEKNEPVADVPIAITDENSVEIKTTTTNAEGKYRFENLPAGKTYKVLLVEENAKLTQKIEYVSGDVQVKASDKVATKKLFENIYFDSDKHHLRPEANKVLADLASYAKAHPEIQIELNANTDSLGSVEYNQKLSQARGDEAKKHLIELGVDKSAIVVNSLGKGHPLAPNTNRIGRLLNRRVEFYIVGGPGYNANLMTYVIEPQENLKDIATRFDMSVDELKQLNDLETDQLIPYTPLRVKRHTGDEDIIAQSSMAHSFKKGKVGSKKYLKEKAKRDAAIEKSMAQSNEVVKVENDSIAKRNEVRVVTGEKKKAATLNLKPGEDYYIVQPKNTLFTISKLYGMPVADIYTLNGLSSDTIKVGQYIKVKTNSRILEANEYLVKEGDTLPKIAMEQKVSVDALRTLNHLEGYILRRNMILKLR